MLDAAGVEIDWDEQIAGEAALPEYGTVLPDRLIESIRNNRVALKGPVATPVGSGFRSVNVALRQELDLFSCVRPCKTYPGINSKFANVDLVIFRENSEDLYAGIEFEQGSLEASEPCSRPFESWVGKRSGPTPASQSSLSPCMQPAGSPRRRSNMRANITASG